LSKLFAEDVDGAAILTRLDPIFAAYAKTRKAGESFGDFVIRAGIVARTERGLDFHANTGPQRGAPAVLDRIAS
jgi:sulfite reductase (NADPH) hemoprotein beta-component